MKPKLLRSGFEQDRGLILDQRRQRKFPLARRLERIAAFDFAALEIPRLAGNPISYSAWS